MANPTILVNNSTGSDSQASGAGPGTALFGTGNASTDATGLIVTLGGSPNLSGVAVDGSAALFLNDTTAGNRNFGKIVAVNNTTKTVTVLSGFPFGLSLSGLNWAIGGVRASIAGTNSLKLISNNNLAGDALSGWVIESQDGHTETFTATLTFRRTGNNTDGVITFRGAANSVVQPVLTWTNNGTAITGGASVTGIIIENLDLRNSSGTKTNTIVFVPVTTNVRWIFRKLRISNSTNSWFRFTTGLAASNVIEDCEIANCVGTTLGAITLNANSNYTNISRCYIHNNATHGIYSVAGVDGPRITNCVIDSNSGAGIYDGRISGNPGYYANNIISNNGADGINIGHTIAQTGTNSTVIELNQIINNTGYGFNFSAGSWTNEVIAYLNLIIKYNNIYNNTLGQVNPGTITLSTDNINVDPQFRSVSGLDWASGTNTRDKGNQNVIFSTNTRTYLDIGFQRKELSPTNNFNRGFN